MPLNKLNLIIFSPYNVGTLAGVKISSNNSIISSMIKELCASIIIITMRDIYCEIKKAKEIFFREFNISAIKLQRFTITLITLN